jgi:protocatechuate 3,4-dioxygenase beta subunit
MKDSAWLGPTRRVPLGIGPVVLSLALALALAGSFALDAPPAGPLAARSARAQELTPGPACNGGAVTPGQTEGPFYKSGSPERTSLLEPGMPGTRLVITGYALTRSCQPIAGAWLDFWQADAGGAYDNGGYRLRGHQFTGDTGRYGLETVVPGQYPGRTPHVHVKVQAPNQPVLTTQLYFPEQPRNSRDGIFNPALLLAIQDTDDGKLARFDFVLDLESISMTAVKPG